MTISGQPEKIPLGVLLDPNERRDVLARLNPELHIESNLDSPPLDLSFDDAEIDHALLTDGYVHLQNISWGELPIAAMANAVNRLKQAGLPIVFVFAYDEFWNIWSKLDPVIRAILGNDYRLLPDFWCWHVGGAHDARGWSPHRDKGREALLPDGRPKSISIWLPLTEATPLNGCMYIVPADRDPTYGTEQESEWKFAHQDIRALPAKAGDVLFWNQAVLHWGARAKSGHPDPRISISLEFQRGDVAPMNWPLLKPNRSRSLETRLELIGTQMLQYTHMSAVSDEERAFAREMAGILAHRVPAAKP